MPSCNHPDCESCNPPEHPVYYCPGCGKDDLWPIMTDEELETKHFDYRYKCDICGWSGEIDPDYK